MNARILDPSEIPWADLDNFEDRVVFQTREWVDFVAATHRARPVVVELRDGGDLAGYFTGLTFQRFGIRILGSSFPGAIRTGATDRRLPATVKALARRELTRVASAQVLGGALGRICRETVARSGVSRLCLAGGDTASFAARALGIEAVEMVAPLTPGAPLCRAHAPGSPADGLAMRPHRTSPGLHVAACCRCSSGDGHRPQP